MSLPACAPKFRSAVAILSTTGQKYLFLAAFNKIHSATIMKFKNSKQIAADAHLAIVVETEMQLPVALLDKKEIEHLKSAITTHTEQWLEINQYNRRIFVYCVKDAASPHIRQEKMRRAGADLAKLANKYKITELTIDAGAHSKFVAEGAALGNYQFLRYFNDAEKRTNTLAHIGIMQASKQDIEHLKILADAVAYARDLINTPVWDLTATQLADSAKEAGKVFGFTVDVLNKKKIEALKMGGLLAVNKGSIDPPTFIIMEHKPAKATNKKPIVLVGKGVVYDTGGLSLKPTAGMDDMKCDMSGAAAVMATLTAIAAANLPVHVVGLVPATDNRPGGNAVTPGDVITMSDGTTVEVMNTDAEGRLILADALHYAKKYKPELVIDLATLTGAAARAIGKYGVVAMGTAGQEAWQRLEASGEDVYERLVRFPFWDEYDELIKSPIADLKNIGGVEGGAITAGKFLAHFTDYPYIHLDIAGPAFVTANDGYITQGGTGVGVRLLFNFLNNY